MSILANNLGISMAQLKSRLGEVGIDPQNPFAEDVLDRKKYADVLTSVVDAYSHSGCVLALNGKWGTGKTTFVNMWKAQMDNQGYKTIYFNAWESDYMEDPLVALVSELKVINASDTSFTKITANVGKILLTTVSSVFKTFLKSKAGVATEVVKDMLEATKDVGLSCLDEYAESKATVKEFKRDLEEYIASSTEGKPVVFFIDELDRCRPDYAVKVLERVKHFFDIPDIVFVLSINKEQLGYAIQGFYGTSNLDSDDYLRRFIDIEYELPAPDAKEFTQYLYNVYGFDDFLNSKKRQEYSRRGDESGELITTSTKLAKICLLDLRTQDRIFAICRISLEAMTANNYLLPDVLYLLCLLKVKYKEIYAGIEAKTYTVQGLIDGIEDNVLLNYKAATHLDRLDYGIEYTIATLIVNYNNPWRGDVIDASFVGADTNQERIKNYPFNVKKLDKEQLNEGLNWVTNHSGEKFHMGLSFIMGRIDLLNPLISQTEE
jgi:hypothetical protein